MPAARPCVMFEIVVLTMNSLFGSPLMLSRGVVTTPGIASMALNPGCE